VSGLTGWAVLDPPNLHREPSLEQSVVPAALVVSELVTRSLDLGQEQAAGQARAVAWEDQEIGHAGPGTPWVLDKVVHQLAEPHSSDVGGEGAELLD
jgi:hypothetical protein